VNSWHGVSAACALIIVWLTGSPLVTDRTRLLTVTIHLRDIADFSGMNAVWEAGLAGSQADAPARTTVEAALATESLRVEATVVAAANTCTRLPS